MKGYRTYAMAAALILHQVLKGLGIDVDQEATSTTVDTVLAVLMVYFRSKA